MKIVSIVGARPQFIKAAMVSRVLRSTPGVQEVVIHTGQHYDKNMSALFFEELEIPEPDYNLGIGSGTHGMQTGRMLQAVEEMLLQVMPGFDGLAMIAKELPVIIPLHPRTRSALNREGLLNKVSESIHMIDAVGYLDMVMLEKHSRLIVTDSGGIQKEAFFYSVPCATLRNETEWVELVELGWNQLIPPFSATKILDGLIGMLGQRGSSASPYGNGHAAQKITDRIRSKWLG